MESSSLLSCPTLVFTSKLINLHQSSKRVPVITASRGRVSTVAAARGEAHGHHHLGRNYSGHGRLVDVNMIVLRKRIHEMKMVERNYEPPSDWMEWEKQYFASYDSLICEVMGVLQSQLMNTRPSLALGMMVLIALSVPLSTSIVFSHFVEIAKMVLDGAHLN